MKTEILVILSFFLTLTIAQPTFAQTLFMGEDSKGVGVQYLFLEQSSQTAHAFALGFSIYQNADVTFTHSSSDLSVSGRGSDFKLKNTGIQFSFFPAREDSEEYLFTGEVIAGIGITNIASSDGYTFFLGTGVSKAMKKNEGGSNLRPRLSAGYTLSTLKDKSQYSSFGYSSSQRVRVGVDISLSIELIADLRLNESATLLLTPSMIFFPNERESGFGFSSSFVF